jgi:sensor histidine kinase YesM
LKALKSNSATLYLVPWVTLAVIHFLLLYALYEMDILSAALDSFVFNSIFALIGVGLWFMVRFSDLSSRKMNELVLYHLSGGAVTLLVWIGSGYFILKNILGNDPYYQAFLNNTLTFRIIFGVMVYALLVTIYYLLINFRELREKSRREAQLTGLLKEAELNMLRSQIRPHFLFNSLNSVSSLTMTDPAKAREMVIKLSEFMRYSFSISETALGPLEKELYHVELYLDIEKVRFGKRLALRKTVDPAALSWPVPVMILQPLIENAVKYGVYESSETTEILLECQATDELLEIKVGNPYDAEARGQRGTGTGLKNIRSRLQNHYGSESLLNISQDNGYFLVTVRIPKYAR